MCVSRRRLLCCHFPAGPEGFTIGPHSLMTFSLFSFLSDDNDSCCKKKCDYYSDHRADYICVVPGLRRFVWIGSGVLAAVALIAGLAAVSGLISIAGLTPVAGLAALLDLIESSDCLVQFVDGCLDLCRSGRTVFQDCVRRVAVCFQVCQRRPGILVRFVQLSICIRNQIYQCLSVGRYKTLSCAVELLDCRADFRRRSSRSFLKDFVRICKRICERCPGLRRLISLFVAGCLRVINCRLKF